MNRREFLRYSVSIGVSFALEDLFSSVQASKLTVENKTPLKDLYIIDAHAHPDRLIPPGLTSALLDKSSSFKAIKKLGMAASSFSAVGDQVYNGQDRIKATEFENTMAQLKWWVKNFVEPGEVKLVLKASDIRKERDTNTPPGAILAIEGGDPLEGNPGRVNEFHRLGVRMITLVHYHNNELGDIMKQYKRRNPGPMNKGLTQAGRKVVERMQDLGMVVDVAHAHPITLQQVAEMSSKPLIDSHTSRCFTEDPLKCGRLRTWKDMEWVAKTDGVICTWPLAYQNHTISRITFLDWAKEILEMKRRLGMEHVGLGTDGGGHLYKLIRGYRDVSDLSRLVPAMEEVGFSKDEISAYLSGNFLRVFRTCAG
jgi:microsomal dipeptidase-like Zn-dependent dipeptidase